MPPEQRTCLDPLLVLTAAATATSSALLGTGTLSAPLRAPIQLARSLAGLDRLSGGRLIAGFGLSWSRDEYEAAGVPWTERGARLDETLDVLAELWGPDPVSFAGRFSSISKGTFQPKPLQQPVPIYLGGASPAALRRAGRRADGWLGVPLPVEALRHVLTSLDDQARAVGRGPVATAIRINPTIQDVPTGIPGVGPIDDLVAYLHSLADLGVTDAFVDLQFTTGDTDTLLRTAETIRTAYP
jgi:probable F420-dependent oxidoreductase